MPDAMDPHPGLLQQIDRVLPDRDLILEKP